MPVSPIGGTGAANAPQLDTASINQTEFLKLFLDQLKFQDPLKPVDNAQTLTQLAQFASLEQSRQMNTSLESILFNSSTGQALALVGKNVDYVGADSVEHRATVKSVEFTASGPMLNVLRPDQTGPGELTLAITLSQVRRVAG